MKKCINPNGEYGICYNFDRFGDRTGCHDCELADNNIKEEFVNSLSGLTEKINKQLLSQIYKQKVINKINSLDNYSYYFEEKHFTKYMNIANMIDSKKPTTERQQRSLERFLGEDINSDEKRL